MKPEKLIDLRSDTVTRPSTKMRAAMAAAEVGDDVYGDDPTVNHLEASAAEIVGTEAAMFVCSGTQSNLTALLTHCGRGDEYIVGQQAHTYKYEGGGAAVLGGIQPQPLEFEADGTLDLDRVAAAIKPDDVHFAKTRLLCLENTVGGRVLPAAYLPRAREFASEHGLGLHLDGARVCNAAVAQEVDLQAITQYFDTVSVCLSKGLGAPVGSVLCGPRDFIKAARRWRKVVGGGMRQAGVLAAAGLIALTENVARLAEDHANAARLGAGLADIPDVQVTGVQTNMVFVSVPPERVAALGAALRECEIIVSAVASMRLVTHLDVSTEDVDRVVAAFAEFFSD